MTKGKKRLEPRIKECGWCQVVFVDDPSNHPNSPHFKRKYCGDECRVAAKSAHLRQMAHSKKKPESRIEVCTCIVCGKSFELELKKRNNYKKRLTCSQTCHTELRQKKMIRQVVCHCGKTFQSVSARQTTCSVKCRRFVDRNTANSRKRDTKYKLALGQYEQMLTDQNGVCMICLQPEKVFRNGHLAPLCVDHCHETGKIRGLLCNTCNTALGKAKHNVVILRRMHAYILRSNPLPEQLTLHAKYLDRDPLT